MRKIIFGIILLLATALAGQAQTSCVRLQEIDGTPNVACVKTIKVTNGTLACTGNVCTITISGGGGSPGGSDTQLQYNNAGSFGGITGATTDGTKVTLVAPILGTPTSGTLTNATGLPISTGLTGAGTGVLTALGVNVGSAGAFVVNGGALGTPSSGTLTNATGLPISTGVAGLGTGVATFLATPSSANLLAALTTSTGTGNAVFSAGPTFTGTIAAAAASFSDVIALTSTTAANNKITQGAAINIGNTSTDGIVLQNTTAAAAGAQQYSPRLHFIGQGWKTNATAASQTVDWIVENQAVQGAANPDSILAFSVQTNGGGYSPVFQIKTAETANSTSNGSFVFTAVSPNLQALTLTPRGISAVPSIQTNAGGGLFVSETSSVATSSTVSQIALFATTSGTPAAGFGPSLVFYSKTNGTSRRQIGGINNVFTDATDATRTSALDFQVINSANLLIAARLAPGSLRMGDADAASPVAQTLSVQNVVGGTSNTAGADFTISGSQGTGTGAGGSIVFKTAPAGGSGTSQNALATAMTINSAGQTTVSGGTVTASTPAFNVTQTWNNGSTTFTGMKVNITATAAASDSLLADFQIGGTSAVRITRSAEVIVTDNGFSGYSFRTDATAAFRADSAGIGIQGGKINLKNTVPIAWSSTGNWFDTIDLYLRRNGAANLALGTTDAASPVAQTLSVQNVVAGTSNTAGVDWTFKGSAGTGTGAGGKIIFQTAPAGTTGTSQNAQATALTIQSDGVVVYKSVTFANLPTQVNAGMIFCSDCSIASPCSGSGNGAFAKGINGQWVCN